MPEVVGPDAYPDIWEDRLIILLGSVTHLYNAEK